MDDTQPRFLRHPHTGVAYPASPELLARGDMLPCDSLEPAVPTSGDEGAPVTGWVQNMDTGVKFPATPHQLAMANMQPCLPPGESTPEAPEPEAPAPAPAPAARRPRAKAAPAPEAPPAEPPAEPGTSSLADDVAAALGE